MTLSNADGPALQHPQALPFEGPLQVLGPTEQRLGPKPEATQTAQRGPIEAQLPLPGPRDRLLDGSVSRGSPLPGLRAQRRRDHLEADPTPGRRTR